MPMRRWLDTSGPMPALVVLLDDTKRGRYDTIDGKQVFIVDTVGTEPDPDWTVTHTFPAPEPRRVAQGETPAQYQTRAAEYRQSCVNEATLLARQELQQRRKAARQVAWADGNSVADQ